MNSSSKQTVNDRLRAFSLEREALLQMKPSKKKSQFKESDPKNPGDPGTAEYQKIIRKNHDARLKSLGITRAYPFIVSDFVDHISDLALSTDKTLPVVLGAIVSAFLAKNQKEQLDTLEGFRESVIKSDFVVLSKSKVQDTSKYSQHNARQKLQGNLRKMMYLRDSDLEKLNSLRSSSCYRSQGNLVNAILKDFFEQNKRISRNFIVKVNCLEI
jgi:hypothetical protein